MLFVVVCPLFPFFFIAVVNLARAVTKHLNLIFAAALIEAIFSMQGRIPDYAPDATAEINDNGRLRMFIPVTSRALCPINVKYFPFDTQNCTFAVSLGDIK